MNDSPEHFTEPITLQRQRGINILPQETFLKKYHPASIHFAEGDMAYVYEDTANPDFVIKKAQRGKDFCMLTEAVAIERITGKSVDVTFTNARYDIEIAVPRINGSKVSQQAIHKVENGERVFVKSVGEAILNAHRKGIVVRDIKYDQFLIKEDGTAEFIDYSSGMIWPDIDTEQLAMFKRQVEAIDSYVNWHSKISTNESAVIKRFCEDFDKVVASCPVPIVVAGGKKISERDALKLAYDSIQNGAVGFDMGRNIFQSESPVSMIKAVRAIVHKNADVDSAFELFNSLKSRGSKKE